MQTVIYCGGLGTRLREETEFRPKPMVKIGDRPIIWHIMKIFAIQGFTEFILPLGYKGEMIKDYFLNYEVMNNDITLVLGHPRKMQQHDYRHNEVGWKITLAATGEKALKGARLKKVEKYVKGDLFFLTYGDGLANVNLQELLAFHQSHGKIATLTAVYPASNFGEIVTKDNCVTSFNEKPDIQCRNRINGGFMVMDRRIFSYLDEEDSCDLEYGPLERLALEGQLMSYFHEGFWACMDTIRDVDSLNKLWNEDRAGWKVW